MSTCTLEIASQPSRRSIFNVNIYLPFLYLYFFFNSVGLPFGLQYTTLLVPLLYLWLLKNRQKWIITRFILCSLPFVAMHLINGVTFKLYTVSYSLIMAVYLVVYAFYLAVSKCTTTSKLFRSVITANFLFALLAIPLRNSSISDLLWWNTYISGELGEMPRLKLLTYEASYYSTLLVPFFMFSYYRMIFCRRKYDYLLLVMTVLPLALSFSFSVISDLLITLMIINIFYFRKLYRSNRLYFKIVMPIMVCALALLILKTPFMARLTDVLTGQDLSATGRTFWSYVLSYNVASQKSLLWGAGLGQVKEYFDFMNDFMQITTGSGWMNASLYNAVAELFAATGIVGVFIKITCEFYLFVSTKTHTNYFRLSLFTFMFAYQFGGSYLTNVAEYAIWVFAFINVFPEFDIIRQGGGRTKLQRIAAAETGTCS